MQQLDATCCVAGGGPAGIMLGYLLARAGVDTIVLEKHKDFLRDFRGDTVHPSTTQVMQDLGLLDEFLQLPHQKVTRLQGVFGSTRITIIDCSALKTPCPYIVFMPQWDFLNFLVEKGKALPQLRVMMEAEVTGLLREGGRVVGVSAKTPEGPMEVRAKLTVGADGRHSVVRAATGLPVKDLHAAIDVFWFRVSKSRATDEGAMMYANHGHFIVALDRGDYFQCGYVLPKGSAEGVRGAGIEAFRKTVAGVVPEIAGKIDELRSFDDVKLLTVGVDRLTKWNAPGVLCIGDAAHTMSPVGGVGINLAVQDAVATANLLAEKLRDGTLADSDLDQVQARRLWPAEVVQSFQQMVQRQLLGPTLRGQTKVPLFLRVISSLPWTRHLAARFIGIGVRPERVTSPH